MTRVLLTGGSGQLGQQLLATVPDGATVIAPPRTELDLRSPGAVRARVEAEEPDVVLHAGAYTQVDKAESEPELVLRVNAASTRAAAEGAAAVGARLIYVSTDYVFGRGHDCPIAPNAERAPLNVYGDSKARGEDAVQEVLGPEGVIVRTSWVYGSVGQSFYRTMRRLMAEREELRIVADQVAVPTSTTTLAEALWSAVTAPSGEAIQHATDAGVASWYDFAVAIREGLEATGAPLALRRLAPIPTEAYPTPAARPRFSRLAMTGAAPHWQARLREHLAADAPAG